MANRKKEVYKPKPMTEGKHSLIQGQEYDIETAQSRTFSKTCFLESSSICLRPRAVGNQLESCLILNTPGLT